jgi:hypothetical protein
MTTVPHLFEFGPSHSAHPQYTALLIENSESKSSDTMPSRDVTSDLLNSLLLSLLKRLSKCFGMFRKSFEAESFVSFSVIRSEFSDQWANLYFFSSTTWLKCGHKLW